MNDQRIELEDIPIPFEAYSGGNPFIFISYAHKDKKVVYKELSMLHDLGFNIWYDEGIEPGNEWPEEVANAVINCAFFLVYISPNAVKSVNVRNEINLAIEENKPFVAIHIENTPLPGGLRLQMGSKQAILKWNMSASNYKKKLHKTLPPNLKDEPNEDEIKTFTTDQTSFNTGELVNIFEGHKRSKSPTATPRRQKLKKISLIASIFIILLAVSWIQFGPSKSKTETPKMPNEKGLIEQNDPGNDQKKEITASKADDLKDNPGQKVEKNQKLETNKIINGKEQQIINKKPDIQPKIKNEEIKEPDQNSYIKTAKQSFNRNKSVEAFTDFTKAFDMGKSRRSEIIAGIANILQRSNRNFKKVFLDNCSKKNRDKFISLLLENIENKYKGKEEQGLKLLAKINFATDTRQYKKISGNFTSILFNRHMTEGQKHFKNKEYGDAVDRYNRAKEYTDKKDLVQSKIELCKTMIKKDQQLNQVEEYITQGDKLYWEKQYSKAIEYYNLGLKIDPDNNRIKSRLKDINNKINESKKKTEPIIKKKQESKKIIVDKPVKITSFVDNDLKLIEKVKGQIDLLKSKSIAGSKRNSIIKDLRVDINPSANIESLIKLFNEIDTSSPNLRSLKQHLYLNLSARFQKSDVKRYLGYFENLLEMNLVVDKKNIAQYEKIRIQNTAEVKSFSRARQQLGSVVAKHYKNSKGINEIELTNGMKFIYVPPSVHRYNYKYYFLSAYFIGKYELTNKFYKQYSDATKQRFKFKEKKINFPVVNISWNKAKAYGAWLSRKMNVKVDMPTEFQWMKAAQSGKTTKYFWGKDLNGDYLWYWGNSGKKLRETGKKESNHWGIFDILGNAAEWTDDWFNSDAHFIPYFNNPQNQPYGTEKIIKGGGWYSPKDEVTISSRTKKRPTKDDPTIGLRLIIKLK